MYKLYMRSDTGLYVTPIYFNKIEEAIHAASPHIKHTPEIWITNSVAENVFETKNGRMIYPQDQQLDQRLNQVPQQSKDHYNKTQLIRTIDDYKEITKDHNNPNSNTDINETRATKVKQLEATISATFAIAKINPYQYGYKPSAVFEAEISQREDSEMEY